MRRTARIALGLLVAAAIAVVVWMRSDRRDARPAPTPPPDAAPLPVDDAEGSEPEEPASDEGSRGAWGITGMVVDDAGRPVAGAAVRIVSAQEGGGFQRGDVGDARVSRTATDGSFVLPELPEGTHNVLASDVRHPVGGLAGPIAIPRTDLHPVLVVLGSAAAVEGVVQQRDGRPVPDATVASSQSVSAVTDRRGEFRLPTLDPRRGEVLRVTAEGYAPMQQGLRLTAGEVVKVVLVLDAGRTVTGRVLDERRSPVQGARVAVLGVPDALAETDARGEFRFTDLPEETLALVASHAEYADSPPRTVPTDERNADAYVELVLRRAGSIAGTVYGVDGAPVMGARVSLVPASGPAALERPSHTYRVALSDGEGAYLFEGLVEGVFSLVARAAGEAGRTDHIALRSGQARAGVDVRLGGRVRITGRIVTAFSEEPVAAAMIEAKFPPAAMIRGVEVPRGTTDHRGRFTVDDVPADVMSLRVSHPAHAPSTFPIAVSGRTVDVGDLALEPRQFGGVGMVLQAREGGIRVGEILEGLPAERAGLQAGDVIVSIDGEQTVGMSLEDAVGLVRGAEGETVTLLVRRGGRGEPFELSLVRTLVEPEARER